MTTGVGGQGPGGDDDEENDGHEYDDDDIYIMVECIYVTKVIIFKWPPVGLLII